MLPDADRPYTRRSTGKQQVANLQGHETADISNDVIHFEKHIRRIPTLHFFTVYIEMEIQLLQVTTSLFQMNVPIAAELSNPLHSSQGLPASRNFRCRSRAVKSIPTVTAS